MGHLVTYIRQFAVTTLLLSAPLQAICNSSTSSDCSDARRWNAYTAESRSKLMRLRDENRKTLDLQLIRELEQRVAEDQSARKALRASRFGLPARNKAIKVDASNARWLEQFLREREFFSAEQVGEYGIHLAWVLFHHADNYPQLQRHALPYFKELYEAKLFDAYDLSQFVDRVLTKQGLPQPFGTQNDWAASPIPPARIGNLAEIDRNRAALSLLSLAEYGCMMHALRREQTNVQD